MGHFGQGLPVLGQIPGSFPIGQVFALPALGQEAGSFAFRQDLGLPALQQVFSSPVIGHFTVFSSVVPLESDFPLTCSLFTAHENSKTRTQKIPKIL